jgi:hypothetical protein
MTKKTLIAVDENNLAEIGQAPMWITQAKADAQKIVEEAKREVPEEIKKILLNIMYWESCPQKYIDTISEYTGVALDEEE